MQRPTPKEAREAIGRTLGISPSAFMQIAMSRVMHNMQNKNASNFERDYLRDLNEVLVKNAPVRPGDSWIASTILADKIAAYIMADALDASEAVSGTVEMYQNERYTLIDDLSKYIRDVVIDDIKERVDLILREKIVPHIYEDKPITS